MKKIAIITSLIILAIVFGVVLINNRIQFLDKQAYQNMLKDTGNDANSMPYSHKMKTFDESYKNAQQEFRPVENILSGKTPILLFGCTFVHGYKLDNTQTFSHALAQVTKRPVYNRAYPGWGIQHMLYQLSREDFYEDVPDPEYIIFLYNYNMHTHCLYEYEFFPNDCALYLRYKNKNGKLERIKDLPKQIQGLYIIRQHFKNKVEQQRKDIYIKENAEFTLKHFKQAKEEALKHFKNRNIKFVVLFYDSKDLGYNRKMDSAVEKLLSQEDFIVLHTSDLVGRVYKCPEDCLPDNVPHPNSKVWKELAPKLAKKLYL